MSHPSIRYFYTCLMCSETIDFWRFHNPQESWDFYHLPSAAGRMDETLMFSHQLWDFPLFDFFILRKLYANICFNGIFWNNSLVPISEQSIQGNCEKYQLKHTTENVCCCAYCEIIIIFCWKSSLIMDMQNDHQFKNMLIKIFIWYDQVREAPFWNVSFP